MPPDPAAPRPRSVPRRGSNPQPRTAAIPVRPAPRCRDTALRCRGTATRRSVLRASSVRGRTQQEGRQLRACWAEARAVLCPLLVGCRALPLGGKQGSSSAMALFSFDAANSAPDTCMCPACLTVPLSHRFLGPRRQEGTSNHQNHTRTPKDIPTSLQTAVTVPCSAICFQKQNLEGVLHLHRAEPHLGVRARDKH